MVINLLEPRTLRLGHAKSKTFALFDQTRFYFPHAMDIYPIAWSIVSGSFRRTIVPPIYLTDGWMVQTLNLSEFHTKIGWAMITSVFAKFRNDYFLPFIFTPLAITFYRLSDVSYILKNLSCCTSWLVGYEWYWSRARCHAMQYQIYEPHNCKIWELRDFCFVT